MSQPVTAAVLQDHAQGQIQSVAPATRLLAAAMAGGFGLVMLFGVALSPIDIIHNAAHDTRHSISVPCH